MASLALRRDENLPGGLFVDRSCIDCGTCRNLAGNFFAEIGGKSAVIRQPESESDWVIAGRAILSCPTESIGTEEKHSNEVAQAAASFPLLIDDGVYYCGYTSEKSYGASSYLIVRSGRNVLVDSPRFNAVVVRKIEQLGGIKYMFLTHKDDVADHAALQRHFNCVRIMHAKDRTEDTLGIEFSIEGNSEISLAGDLLAIPTPGHTEGHMVLLYKEKFLFSGDHLALRSGADSLHGFRRHCWYSWQKQMESVLRLKKYRVEWLLPGHGCGGRITNFASAVESYVKAMEETQ